ncbi:hypothetical protein I5T96_15600 [Serratia marcescens]|nr:hypothetical protein [Serratia marcescens]
MKNIVENQYIKIDNSDFTFLTNQKSWLKIPADGSPLTFTGNADEAAKEFFNALIRVRDGYISALKAERDALAQRVEMLAENLGNAIWGEQEALQRVNALAVENAALKQAGNKMFLSAISLMEDPELKIDHSRDIKDWERNETPATDAALAAIQAQGVEKFADDLHKTAMAMCSVKPDNTTPGAYAGLARSFAKKLREAK